MSVDTGDSSFTNDAFISYSRKDKDFASRLEKALEDYKPPKDLNVPQRNLVVFRGEVDFEGLEYQGSVNLEKNERSTMEVRHDTHLSSRGI